MLSSYTRKIAALSLLLTLPASALHPLTVRAHGPDHSPGHAAHEVLHLPAVETYTTHLEQSLAEAIRDGSGSVSDEQERLGRELFDAAHAEITQYLNQHPDTLTRSALDHAREWLSALNPIALGRWLVETALRQGPTLAVALGIAEISEQVGVYLAVKNPEFAFLLPIYFFHLGEAVVLTLAFGGPGLLRMLERIQAHGGILEGPGRYYQHLLRQRQALPIDWNEALLVSRLPGEAPAEDSVLDFVVIREGQLERRLPTSVRVLLGPKRLAQRESFATIAIWELERIAEEQGRRPLRKIKKQHPRLYASLLLHEISLDAHASANLRASLAARRPSSATTAVDLRTEIDLEEFFRNARDPGDLRAVGGSPDLLAQRLLWHLDARLHEREESLHDASPSRAQLRALRQAERALRDPRGLEKIAATGSDWQALYETLASTREAFRALDREAPIPCEEAFF